MHIAPNPDPRLLDEGILLIAGMTTLSESVTRNTSLSKRNRDFYRHKQEALEAVVFYARLGAKLSEVLHG